ncbi:hypothetical protein [Flexivirga oryzae]|uniref:Uncharacterized protein n=1 Tax=Flexivirga oryzae TaxID=1794944 RepID=A0A839N0B4_9MICO|nr:hypothetical protein [Flexivirga oryzae]MBB2891138.1 hypothetical protein [Flexivirga oryzae]
METQAQDWSPVPWLMRSWRRAAPDPALRVQPRMIEAMKAYPGVRKTLVPGTLTRYEKGELTPPLPVIAALEDIVGLPQGEISSYLPAGKLNLRDRSAQWSLLTRADAADTTPLSGQDWLDLATLVTTGTPQSPERVAFWSHLLVNEMSRSTCAGYRLRIRALELLAADAVISGPVEDAVRDHLTACGHTVIGDALAALTEVHHPRGTALALQTYRSLRSEPAESVAHVLAIDLRQGRTRPHLWGAIRDTLREDLSSGHTELESVATIVASSLTPVLLRDVLYPFSREQSRRVQLSIVRSRPETLPTADAREFRIACASLARELAGQVTRRHEDGLATWLWRALVDGTDPFIAGLVVSSSPYGHALSHELERRYWSGSTTRQGPLGRAREFPFTSVALGTCRRRDPETLAAAYRAGSPSEKRRLLTPLAHHRAFPGEIDLTTAMRETGATSRVIYAAGMSAHPGLTGLDDPAIPGSQRRAARWWANGPDPSRLAS